MKASKAAVLATSLLFLILTLAGAVAAAPKQAGPDSLTKPGVTVPQGTMSPATQGFSPPKEPVQLKLPDLHAGVVHHYIGGQTCGTLGWLMWNKGTAPLPDRAYNPYSNNPQESGVVIRIYKMNPYMQIVKNVMLKDVDPLHKIQPVDGGLDAGPVDLGPNFTIQCSHDLNNNQWGEFQVRLDADQTFNEIPPDDDNAFTKVVPCWCP